MTDHALQERITRSLAYMLRHQPEKFDVEVDPNGFAEIGEVVRALNERLGEPVVQEDLEAAVTSGDRQRYEIEEGRIRALYGHSIPVEPGESSKPPELLYLAVPERDVERARRYGLRGGRRRFVHLALTEDDAREVGKRAAEVYSVLTIHALDAWEEGISFYDRKSLFLAENVPTQLIEVGPTYDDGDPPRRAPERDGRDRGSRRGGRRPRSEGGSEGRSDGRSGDEARRETRAAENGGRSRRGGGRQRDRGRDRDRGRGGRGDREPRRARTSPAPSADPSTTAVAAAAEPPPVRRKAPARPADAPAFGAGLIHEPKDEPTPEVAAPVEEQTAEHIEAAPDLIAEEAPDTIEPPPEPEAREPEPKTDTTGFGAGIV